MSLEGTLSDMSLGDLFEAFHAGRKSGVLQLFTPTQRASLYVTMGRVIDAMVVRIPQQELVAAGDEAVMQIFSWEKAEFVFKSNASLLYHPVTIFYDPQELAELGSTRFGISGAPVQAPIKVDCSFSLEPGAVCSGQPRFEHHYRKQALSSARAIAPLQPNAPESWSLDLAPCDEELAVGQRSTHAGASAPRPARLPARPAAAPAPAAQPFGAPQAAAPQPSRRLMQAILRRVRSL